MQTTRSDHLGPAARRHMEAEPVDIAELVRLHHETLTRLCYVITGDGELAADAVQNAWAIAVRKIHQLRSPAAAKSWLMAIATNEARSALRGKKRAARVKEALITAARSGPSAQSPADTSIIADLPPRDRQLLALAYIAGLSSAEIGTILGLSAEGVRTRKFRLIHRLRAEMTHETRWR